MKSQVLTLLLLTISAQLFPYTHQYRLRKRELTEYHLTSFIVKTCSAEKIDVIIQNLCDQTLQSALMGNFPFLTYYCQIIGSGNRFCENVNRQTSTGQHIEAKRFGSRRFTREINEDNKESETKTDLDHYPQIQRLCQSLPGLNSCRQLLSFSLTDDASSSISSSIPVDSSLSSVPFQQSSDLETLVDQHTINSNS